MKEIHENVHDRDGRDGTMRKYTNYGYPFYSWTQSNAHRDRQPTGVTQHMSLAASYCFWVLPSNFRDRGKTCIRTFIEAIAFIFGRGSNTVKKQELRSP